MKASSFLLLIILGLYLNPAWSESLFQDSNYDSLVSDKHAVGVGDVITILIYESASATANADSESEKKIGLGVDANADLIRYRYGVAIDNEYSSGGEINRGGRLVANVSVTVQEVFANGDMRVAGGQELEFNDEKQLIRIQGRIRPEDISADNTVLSTRLADAKIEYVGDGVLGASTGPGIFTSIFNFLF